MDLDIKTKAKDVDWVIRRDVACDIKAPIEILRETLIELSKDEDYRVRSRVAENKNTPQKVLDKLSLDQSWVVKCHVAKNVNTPKETLRQMAEKWKSTNTIDTWDLVHKIAKNPSTPKDVLYELSKNIHINTKEGVAENPNTPEDLLKHLAKNSEVWCTAIDNENLPKFILKELAASKKEYVRICVLNSKHADSEIEEIVESTRQLEKYFAK